MDDYTDLGLAIAENNLKEVKRLVEEEDADINETDCKQMTPLNMAMYEGAYEIAKYLLDHGADPLIPNDYMEFPFDEDKVREYARKILYDEIKEKMSESDDDETEEDEEEDDGVYYHSDLIFKDSEDKNKVDIKFVRDLLEKYDYDMTRSDVCNNDETLMIQTPNEEPAGELFEEIANEYQVSFSVEFRRCYHGEGKYIGENSYEPTK